jgi:hypothetical protein
VRNSDRWITPGVIITGLLVAGLCVLATIAAVAWLTREGMDPQPLLQLVGTAIAALASAGGFVVQLLNRASVTKTERNTGVLATAVYDVADAMPRPLARHSAE